ncbi:hypothetical protein CA11_10190 [Gimesia maris]|nr:hypothetical protein CA11_10190 [Gimesia maris]
MVLSFLLCYFKHDNYLKDIIQLIGNKIKWPKAIPGSQ